MNYFSEESLSLLETLCRLSPDSSKTTLRSWIKQGRVSIDGRLATRADAAVVAGQCVTVERRRQRIEGDLEILYQDRHLIIIDKPADLLSVAAAYSAEATAHAILKRQLNKRVQVVHRLDKGTSGVMVFAFTDAALEGLKERFKAHDMQRQYRAVVEGGPDDDQGTWESYLVEDANYYVQSTNSRQRGRRAVTHFQVLARGKRYSFVEFTLETGRKNQIRVHCQDAGCSIAGDSKYGCMTNPLRRLCLHARRLAFVHPVTNKLLDFTSPEPDKFRDIVS